MSTYNLSFILFALLIITKCSPQKIIQPLEFGRDDLVPRVVNGRPANLGDVPYQIAFKSLTHRILKQYKTFCGGSIISERKLLSAAHCFESKKSGCFFESIHITGRPLARFYAVAGNLLNSAIYSNDTDGGQWRKLKVVIYPSKYKFPKHDICVVIVTSPYFFNDHVAPIPYARKYIDYKDRICLVSGYGRQTRTSSYKQVSSEYLLLADLPVISARLCNRRHRKNMKNFVCTSDQVSDVSKGDSGGPLVCFNTMHEEEKGGKGILVGIVSGNRYRAGSFFTRVSSYYKYIERNKANRLIVLANLPFYFIIYCEFYLFQVFPCCHNHELKMLRGTNSIIKNKFLLLATL